MSGRFAVGDNPVRGGCGCCAGAACNINGVAFPLGPGDMANAIPYIHPDGPAAAAEAAALGLPDCAIAAAICVDNGTKFTTGWLLRP